jgi:hypothetical protein
LEDSKDAVGGGDDGGAKRKRKIFIFVFRRLIFSAHSPILECARSLNGHADLLIFSSAKFGKKISEEKSVQKRWGISQLW